MLLKGRSVKGLTSPARPAFCRRRLGFKEMAACIWPSDGCPITVAFVFSPHAHHSRPTPCRRPTAAARSPADRLASTWMFAGPQGVVVRFSTSAVELAKTVLCDRPLRNNPAAPPIRHCFPKDFAAHAPLATSANPAGRSSATIIPTCTSSPRNLSAITTPRENRRAPISPSMSSAAKSPAIRPRTRKRKSPSAPFAGGGNFSSSTKPISWAAARRVRLCSNRSKNHRPQTYMILIHGQPPQDLLSTLRSRSQLVTFNALPARSDRRHALNAGANLLRRRRRPDGTPRPQGSISGAGVAAGPTICTRDLRRKKRGGCGPCREKAAKADANRTMTTPMNHPGKFTPGGILGWTRTTSPEDANSSSTGPGQRPPTIAA